MIKNCIECNRILPPLTDDEPRRLIEFCSDCLATIRAEVNADFPEAPDESPRLHHNCETCVGLQRREHDRERMGSAAAWAFMWFCVGLLSSRWVDEWLFGNAPWPAWMGW